MFKETLERLDRLKAALSYIPDATGQLCFDTLKETDCSFWSYKTSDAISQKKVAELARQNVLGNKQNSRLFSMAAQEALKNPLQYLFLRGVEGFKMFFWESTSMGFVAYPDWLSEIYDSKIFNRALTWSVGIVTIIAFFYAFAFLNPTTAGIIIFLLIYNAAHSFFLVLPRYALPVAPLYIILIAFMLNGNPKTK